MYLKDLLPIDICSFVGNTKMQLCLSFLFFAFQVFMACSQAIGDERMMTKKEPLSFERNNTETPSFLSTFYEELMEENEAHGMEYFLESFQAEWHRETDEFLQPSLVRAPGETVRRAEFFLSTHELAANKKLTVSIYEARTGVKMSSRQLPSNRSDWLPLPVTGIIKRWIARKDAPLRFKVFVHPKGGYATAITDDMKIPKVWLVLHSEAQHEQAFPYLAPHFKISGSSVGRMQRDIPTSKMAASEIACRRVDMVIDSLEFGKSAKLIYPRSFNAYQCSGNCSSNSEKTKFVNNAILKALVSQRNGIKAKDKSCCIPFKLKPITLILNSDKGGYLIKTVRDFVVEECRCY